jgi:hypothetical protein
MILLYIAKTQLRHADLSRLAAMIDCLELLGQLIEDFQIQCFFPSLLTLDTVWWRLSGP